MPQGEGTYGSEVGRPPKKNSPMGYIPFKMKGHELPGIKQRTPNTLKAFGTKDSDMPDSESTSPGKFGGLGAHMAKFGGGGASKMMRAMMEKIKGINKGMPTPEAEAGSTMMDKQAATVDQEGVEGGEAAAVPPHGPEAHTGGANPIGVVKRKGAHPFAGSKISNLLFSDVRLKEKIEKTGISPSGIPTYEFNYIGGTNRYSGTMAQDLLAINPDAVSMDASGYYKVNYDNIDVDMHLINN
jgi:hypothetical protein